MESIAKITASPTEIKIGEGLETIYPLRVLEWGKLEILTIPGRRATRPGRVLFWGA